MRVAIFTPFLYPFHVDMLNALSDIAKVKLFACGIYGNYPFQDLLKCAEVLKCTDILGSKLLSAESIVTFLKFRPNVVIIFGIESFSGIILYILSKACRINTVVIVEENNITSSSKKIVALLGKIKRTFVKNVYASADILIAESLASKYYVLRMLRINRKKPIFVQPHGVDTRLFRKYIHMDKTYAKKLITSILKLPGNTEGRLWIGFIGEPSFYKGVDVLIDSIFILKSDERLRRVVFLLPASTLLRDRAELRDTYIEKLQKLVEKGIVTLYQPISIRFMPIFYRALDVVVLPSRLLEYASSDRSPNVALEALASGSLLIASRAGGIPDIVGEAGILVKPNDPQALAEALRDVIENYDAYKHLTEKAYQRAKEYLDIRLYTFFILTKLLESTFHNSD